MERIENIVFLKDSANKNAADVDSRKEAVIVTLKDGVNSNVDGQHFETIEDTIDYKVTVDGNDTVVWKKSIFINDPATFISISDEATSEANGKSESDDYHIQSDMVTAIRASGHTGDIIKDGLPMYIIDGKPSTEEEFNALDHDQVKNITLVKDGYLTMNGEEAKVKNVVIVKLKDGAINYESIPDEIKVTRNMTVHFDNSVPFGDTIFDKPPHIIVGSKGNPDGASMFHREFPDGIVPDDIKSETALYIIDNKPSTEAEFNALDRNRLEKVLFYKDGSETLHGKDPIKGVIVVTTKKAAEAK